MIKKFLSFILKPIAMAALRHDDVKAEIAGVAAKAAHSATEEALKRVPGIKGDEIIVSIAEKAASDAVTKLLGKVQ